MVRILIGIMALSVAAAWYQQPANEGVGRGPLTGIVRYPDGRPAAEAAVRATADCGSFHLVREALTLADGSFEIQPFSEHCSPVRFTASKKSEFYLETRLGDIFYGEPIGTSPLIEVPPAGLPHPATVVLGARGSLVTFRVWDTATARFIYAGIGVRRIPVPGKKFGSMQTSTGRDGSAHTLFLPPGEYEVEIWRYACNDADYFAKVRPKEIWKLQEAESVEKVISVDVREIAASRTYSNPTGAKCAPRDLAGSRSF